VRSWGLSVQEQHELWRRWRQGASLRLIARRLGQRAPSGRAFVLQTGGVQQHPPPRALWCRSMAEREDISRGVAAGEPCRQIAAGLGRAPSTVSRELASNGGRHRDRARPPMPRPSGGPSGQAGQAGDPAAAAGGGGQAGRAMSPEQIAGWLPLAYPQEPVLGWRARPSSCRGASRAGARPPGSCSAGCAGVGRGALHRPSACPRAAASAATPSRAANDPPEAADRAVPGHWEGDLGAWQATQRGRDPGRGPPPLCAGGPAPPRGSPPSACARR
jgi:hypothetical protein